MRSRPISAAGMTLLNNRTLLHQPVAGEISARSEIRIFDPSRRQVWDPPPAGIRPFVEGCRGSLQVTQPRPIAMPAAEFHEPQTRHVKKGDR